MATPLDRQEFARLLDPMPRPPRGGTLAVAVSGGADSMALVLLAARWARQHRRRLVALTVDHGLRRESAAEARQVGRWLKVRGIAHHVLVWRGTKPRSNLQGLAREARYRLMARWCARHAVRHLLLAHQMEDQAETVLMRLGRGSGVDGLCGMAAVTEGFGLTLLRPLLTVPRARLEATIEDSGQPWIEDPSNLDPKYLRSQVRAAMAALAPEGLAPRRIADTARRMARVRAALDSMVADLGARAVKAHRAGFFIVDPAALVRAPAEIRLRLLAQLLKAAGGEVLPPRMERLEALDAAIAGARLGRGRTLHGCRVLPWRDRLLVCRELAAVAAPVPAAIRRGTTLVWDGRYRIRASGRFGRGTVIGALGDRAGASGAGPGLENLPAWIADIPAPVRPTLPAVWQGRRLLALPAIGMPDQRVGQGRLRLDFTGGIAGPALSGAENPVTVV